MSRRIRPRSRAPLRTRDRARDADRWKSARTACPGSPRPSARRPRRCNPESSPPSTNHCGHGSLDHLRASSTSLRDPDLVKELPIPRFFEHETGPYITAGAIVAKDSLTGRGEPFDRAAQAARRQPCHGRDRAEPSSRGAGACGARARRNNSTSRSTVGNHPAVLLAACLYLQLGEDELEVAGGLLGEPIEVARCLASDLVVPAQCECVLEGTLDLNEEIEEGPVSEFHGLYENYGHGVVATFSRLTRRIGRDLPGRVARLSSRALSAGRRCDRGRTGARGACQCRLRDASCGWLRMAPDGCMLSSRSRNRVPVTHAR